MSIQLMPSADQLILVIHRHTGQAVVFTENFKWSKYSDVTALQMKYSWERQVKERTWPTMWAQAAGTNGFVQQGKLVSHGWSDIFFAHISALLIKNYCWQNSVTPQIWSHYLLRHIYGIHQELGRTRIIQKKYCPHSFYQTSGFHTKLNRNPTLSSSVQFKTAACCKWCPKSMFTYFASLQTAKLHFTEIIILHFLPFSL